MNAQTEALIESVRRYQSTLTAEERKEFWDELRAFYCHECGREDPNHTCQCWNDE